MPPAKRTNRQSVPSVEEIVANTLGSDEPQASDLPEDTELGTVVEGKDGVERVLVSKEWLELMEQRLVKSERGVVAKVKDVVVSHKRQLILAGTTVAGLAAAAYVVTHKDELLEDVEKGVEVVSESVELGAQDVKKSARTARTGSPIKNSARDK